MPGPSTTFTAPGHGSHASNGPTSVAECEAVARLLQDKDVPLRRRVEMMSELKDSAEQPREFNFYGKYLEVLVPAVMALLGDEDKIVFYKDHMEQVRTATTTQDPWAVTLPANRSES